MPRITEELVRRRAEHNNCEITTLEELSLHQQEIERIEHLDKWCRDLKILYLQNNIIPKIENVGRLKQLQYLNVALNNIEKIENLEGCEFLQKLDLTVNFVGDLLSVETLRSHCHLTELYLTGNPCTDYDGYREFVVATLPQLMWLDGREVSKSERILAVQRYDELRRKIVEQQKEYQVKREREKREYEMKQRGEKKPPGFDGRWYTDTSAHFEQNGSSLSSDVTTPSSRARERDSDDEERFWSEPTAYTPESRTEVHNYMAEKRKEKDKEPGVKGPDPPKRQRRLEKDGRMMNVNEGRYDFHLEEDSENNQYVLEVACPRFMDTSLVDCDVQPTYVRVTIKGKVLQLVLQEEVSPDKSSVKRSQTTGKLLITLPKALLVVRPSRPRLPEGKRDQSSKERSHASEPTLAGSSRPLLEVDPSLVRNKTDIHHIVQDKTAEHVRPPPDVRTRARVEEIDGCPSEDFVDDSDVPPLI